MAIPQGNFSRNPFAFGPNNLAPMRSMINRAMNATRKKADKEIQRRAENIAGQSQDGISQLGDADTTIFYPDELSLSPEYQAYMLIHVYQAESDTLNYDQAEVASANLSAAIDNLSAQAIAAKGGEFVASSLGAAPILGTLGGAAIGGLLNIDNFTRINYTDPGKNRIPPSRQTMNVKSQFSRISTSIGLPMPKTLKTNYGFEYEDMDFSNATLVSTLAQVISQEGITDDQRNFLAGKATSLGRGITDSLMNIIPGGELNLDAYANTREGIVKSPLSENIFKQVTRRSFDFSWTLIPKNRREVDSIMQIIRILKSYSHPASIVGNPYYLEVPGEFLVQFLIKKEENLLVPKLGRLCMKEISVDYGSENGMSFFRMENDSNIGGIGTIGGALPTKMNLTIKFEELERLTRDSISQGY